VVGVRALGRRLRLLPLMLARAGGNRLRYRKRQRCARILDANCEGQGVRSDGASHDDRRD